MTTPLIIGGGVLLGVLAYTATRQAEEEERQEEERLAEELWLQQEEERLAEEIRLQQEEASARMAENARRAREAGDQRIEEERATAEQLRQEAQAAAEARPDLAELTGAWHGGKFYPYSGDPTAVGTIYVPGYGAPPPLPPERRGWRLEIDKFSTAPATIDNDKYLITGRVYDDNGNLQPSVWIRWTATQLTSGWSRQLETAGRHSALMFMPRGTRWRIDANVDYRYGSGREIHLHDSFTFRVR